jgi:hypothetical protein
MVDNAPLEMLLLVAFIFGLPVLSIFKNLHFKHLSLFGGKHINGHFTFLPIKKAPTYEMPKMWTRNVSSFSLSILQ